MDFTIEECQEWLENKDVNPRTQRSISESGSVYKKLHKKCIEYGLIDNDDIKNYSVNEMKRLSKMWNENKNINPIDGTKIKKSSKIYKKLKSWYITFYYVRDNTIRDKIIRIANELNTEGIDVDDYLEINYPEMIKYKNNILHELNKM